MKSKLSNLRYSGKQGQSKVGLPRQSANKMALHKKSNQAPDELVINTLVTLFGQGQLTEAQTLARSLTVRFPQDGFGWKMLGGTLHAQGQLSEALPFLQKAVELMPQDAEALVNLSTNLVAQDRQVEAMVSLINCLALKPDYAIGHFNLGSILRGMGQLNQAETYLRQAVELDPDFADAHVNLGMTLQDLGRTTQAVQCYRRALEIKPDYLVAYNNLLFCLGHDLWTNPKQLFAEHLAFAERFEAPLRADWRSHDNSKDPGRCLQIGFVSADLFGHAVANFLMPVLEGLAKYSALSLHAYYTNTIEDSVTLRLRNLFTHWHDVAALSSDGLADAIRANQIDILFDLSGHTAHNRLLTFARKPAPIQVTWIGYPGTTGLQAMDYILCDRFYIPPEQTWQLTEKAVYLPTSCIFEPSVLSAPVNALPALTNGYVTFGSFNRPDKLNESVIALWSMLLRQVPTAKMLVGATPPEHQDLLVQIFARNGIEQNRLAFFPRSNLPEYFALHHQVDICLDSYPYGGGTTTFHAAWMGVPTLTLAGETPPSRVGATIMSHLGLQGFVATSIEDFVSKGCHWAEHLDELAQVRHETRLRVAMSPARQTENLVACLALALRAMWQHWCDGLPPQAFEVSMQDVLEAKPESSQ